MPRFKTKIICLKQNEHSVRIAKDSVAQAEKFNLPVEYFDAIHGNDYAKHCIELGVTRVGKVKKGRKGVIGCFLSHLSLWKQCAKDGIPYVILEHDGYFIRELPDNIWGQFNHVCKLDNYDPFSKYYNREVEKSLTKDVEIIDYHNAHAKGKKVLNIVGNYFRGAWSYIIKPEAANVLINFVNEHGMIVAADQQIGSNLLELKTTNVPIARLHPFYSIGTNINSESLTKKI